ncbi:MAG: hypothetical protein JJU00_18385, partial [Opitutales bacterium]|nr:hypothetical protein [Opitutales bacterium]
PSPRTPGKPFSTKIHEGPLFLNAGADINAAGKEGSALGFARFTGNAEVAKLLPMDIRGQSALF